MVAILATVDGVVDLCLWLCWVKATVCGFDLTVARSPLQSILRKWAKMIIFSTLRCWAGSLLLKKEIILVQRRATVEALDQKF